MASVGIFGSQALNRSGLIQNLYSERHIDIVLSIARANNVGSEDEYKLAKERMDKLSSLRFAV